MKQMSETKTGIHPQPKGKSRMGDKRKEPKDSKRIYDKPISIPVPFEDTLRDLLVTPPEPKEKKADKPKKSSRKQGKEKPA